ncbi:MAG: hypothetical protein SFU85_07660 [Candidatus Methylacidiphilales bacterium]|nr:hypothetical protein [Candidatus Methylacidiphilales bacterium]
MTQPTKAGIRIAALLERLEGRARGGPGLYPVREAGDFFLLAQAGLGWKPFPFSDMERLGTPEMNTLAGALDNLLRDPVLGRQWANRLLLLQGRGGLAAVPAGASRRDTDPSDALLTVLRSGENTCPAPRVRTAS